MATKITDVLVPKVFGAYMDKAPLEQNEFYQSGVIERTPYFDALAAGAGYTANLPKWAEIDADDFDSRTDGDNGLPTFDKVTTVNEVAIKCFDKLAVGSSTLVSELAGSNAVEAISRKLGNKVTSLLQARLLQTLKGLFASTDMAGNQSTVTLANFNNNAIVEAQGLLGERQDRVVAIAMHSKLYTELKKLNLLTNHATLISDITGSPVEFLGNKRVIIDDKLVDGTNYLAYLFVRGAVAYGRGGEEYPIEIGKIPHMEEEGITIRYNHIFHPHGATWKGTSGLIVPKTELVKGTNWGIVYDPKEIGIVQLTVTP